MAARQAEVSAQEAMGYGIEADRETTAAKVVPVVSVPATSDAGQIDAAAQKTTDLGIGVNEPTVARILPVVSARPTPAQDSAVPTPELPVLRSFCIGAVGGFISSLGALGGPVIMFPLF